MLWPVLAERFSSVAHQSVSGIQYQSISHWASSLLVKELTEGELTRVSVRLFHLLVANMYMGLSPIYIEGRPIYMRLLVEILQSISDKPKSVV